MSDLEQRRELERLGKSIGTIIGEQVEKIRPGCLFALLLMDAGEGGFASHISNAERPDFIKFLREMIEKLESGEAGSVKDLH